MRQGARLTLNNKGKELYGHIFPKGQVPCSSFLFTPQKVNLQGVGETEVYFVDLNALTAEQYEQLVIENIKRTKESYGTVYRGIKETGLPIRAELVALHSCNVLWFLDDEGSGHEYDPELDRDLYDLDDTFHEWEDDNEF